MILIEFLALLFVFSCFRDRVSVFPLWLAIFFFFEKLINTDRQCPQTLRKTSWIRCWSISMKYSSIHISRYEKKIRIQQKMCLAGRYYKVFNDCTFYEKRNQHKHILSQGKKFRSISVSNTCIHGKALHWLIFLSKTRPSCLYSCPLN